MLVVISPAKRLDWSPVDGIAATEPAFAADAVQLARVARRLSKPKLQALMKISPELARLNQERFRAFSDTPELHALRPAAFAFAGDTYQGLDARTLDTDALHWAQGHLRILSGLYGLLRPLDAIQPYRLEMGSRLRTRKDADLYAYWGPRLAEALNEEARQTGAGLLVNCASQEYFGAVDRAALQVPVISPVFLEDHADGPRIVSFHAKRARGALARYIVERRVTDPEALQDFDTGGYAFDPGRSQPDAPVFLRAAAQSRAPADAAA